MTINKFKAAKIFEVLVNYMNEDDIVKLVDELFELGLLSRSVSKTFRGLAFEKKNKSKSEPMKLYNEGVPNNPINFDPDDKIPDPDIRAWIKRCRSKGL